LITSGTNSADYKDVDAEEIFTNMYFESLKKLNAIIKTNN